MYGFNNILVLNNDGPRGIQKINIIFHGYLSTKRDGCVISKIKNCDIATMQLRDQHFCSKTFLIVILLLL